MGPYKTRKIHHNEAASVISGILQHHPNNNNRCNLRVCAMRDGP
jgi:hypothetical protein